MAILLTDSFENGLSNYRISGYGGAGLQTSTAYAHHGINSVIYNGNNSLTRDFVNTAPSAEVYFSGYVHFDDPIVSPVFPGNANGVGIFEMRDTEQAPICYLQTLLNLTEDNYYHWLLITFDMGHISGGHSNYNRFRVTDPIVPNHPYKYAVSYAFIEPSTRRFQLWIDDVLKGTIEEYYPYHFYANNIYLGAPKAEYGAGLASGAYLDCIGIAHEYPTVDYFSNIASLSVNATLPDVRFLMETV